MKPPTIYIPQRPHPSQLEDITTKAVKFGEVRVIMGREQIVPIEEHPNNRAPWMITPEDAVHRLWEGLASVCADDYVLAIGDPVAVAIAFAIVASRTGGRVNVLKWDRQAAEYYAVPVNLPKGGTR